ncbi:MAG: pyridoxal phosphate-dependent aminotransferase family protein, partial [bacterium]|nr:pyridoxal phosphate-dependent aminotransferase family protein [bacterium]
IELEKWVIKFFGRENILYFFSGCFGNSVLLEGLIDDYDAVFVDKQSHDSIMSFARMTYKPVLEFEDRSPDDLEKKLKNLDPQKPLLMCDGIFPISGEMSPLADYIEVLKKFENAVICVDDSHATGVIGKNGRGTFEFFDLDGENRYSSGTLSKAVGGHGGIITGNNEFIRKLKEKSPIPRACSPPSIPATAATAKGLEILYNNPGMRTQLWDNVAYAKNGLRRLGFETNSTPVPIICLSARENIDSKKVQTELFEKNIAVTHVPPGAYSNVPENGALRISIFSTHSHDQIDHLIDAIKCLM